MITDKQGGLNNDQSAEASTLTGRTLSFSFFTAISRVFGLLRDVVLFHAFGASGVMDAFLIAFTIPNVMRRLVAEGAFAVAFVPVYTQVRQQQSEQAAKRFFAEAWGALVLVLPGLVALGVIYAKPLVYAFASGFARDPAKLELAVVLTRWLFPYLFFVSVLALFMGVLNCHGHFGAPAAAPILLNSCMIGAALAGKTIHAVAAGVLVAGLLQVLLQLPFLARQRVLVFPSRPRWSGNMRRLVRMMVPALFGIVTYQLNIIVLRQLASTLPDGSVSYYYIADRLMQLALGTFAVAVATASLPTMSAHRSRGQDGGLLQTWLSACRLTHFVTVPAACALAVLAVPIVAVLYGHGSFVEQDVRAASAAVVVFAPGLVAAGLVRVTVQAFYACQDMRTPVLVSAVGVLINGLLGWGLLGYGVVGLGGALTLSTWLQAGVLIGLLHVRMRGGMSAWVGVLALLRPLGPAAAAIAAAWLVAWRGQWELGTTLWNVLVLGITVLVGVCAHLAISAAVGLPEVGWVLTAIRRIIAGVRGRCRESVV
ncbi:MAG: murein biosynthesis integral membrane protein MurJ [Myxococcota bacterium]